MSDFLTQIIQRKEKEVQTLAKPRRLQDVLKQNGLAVIAEIKRRSPSKGVLKKDVDAATFAKLYEEAGAAAISVLTDHAGFGGCIQDLKDVVAACPQTPVLRKDFILDHKQLYETARAGAHAVLLIAAVLQERLGEFIQVARELGLETLVEVHNLSELELAHRFSAPIIGVNNRNLATFQTTLSTAVNLAEHFASSVIKVAESGITGPQDAALMRRAGYDAILVGEALMLSSNPQKCIEELKNAH